jgi:flagellar basal-body rod protein FlgF
MDRLIYTAMSGAKHILEQQATNSHNLANASTTGFRAQLDSFRAVPVLGPGMPTRTFVVDATVGSDFAPATIQHTGRDLDVAIQGEGWFAVETLDGNEAYTRNGAFRLNENGVLQTQNGLNVIGDGGPITLPPGVSVAIAKDGTISTIDPANPGVPPTAIGRLKLVNPPQEDMARGEDGLFRRRDGAVAPEDANVTVAGGALESSNVNVVDAMVNMISLARQFDLHMNMMKNAENNATKAGQLLALGGG